MSHVPYMSDAGLLASAATGNGVALATLVERHAHRLYDVALRLGHTPARAADLTVQTYTALAGGQVQLSAPPALDDLREALLVLADAGGGELALAEPALDSNAAPLTPELADDLLWRVLQALPPEHWPPAVSSAPTLAGGLSLAVTLAPAVTSAPEPRRRQRRFVPPWSRVQRRRDRYRHLDRRSRLPQLLALAAVAVLLAVAATRFLATSSAPTPTPNTVGQNWPTLPPRATATPRASATADAVAAALSPTATAMSAPATSAPLLPPTMPPTRSVALAPTTAIPSTPSVYADRVPDPAPTPTTSRAPTLPPPTPAPPRPSPVVPTVTPAPRPSATATPEPTATAEVPPTPPMSAELNFGTPSLNFGLEVGPRLLKFSNPRDAALPWRVVADSTWLEISMPSGTLAPGASTQVAVTIARGGLPTGTYTGNLQVITPNGTELIPVTMQVSPSGITIGSFAEPAAPINADGCADPTTYLVTADISGSSAPQQAVVYYALNSGVEVAKPLTASGKRYSATLGPFAVAGSVTFSLVVIEADGTVNRSSAYQLVVQDCPSRVRTAPVTLPTSQRFSLGAGGHNVYTFPVTEPGNIIVQVAWAGDATRLSTLLYGPRRTDQPYDQRTGTKSLAFAYPVTAEDVAAGGLWALHLVNYAGSEANGTFVLTFEPRGSHPATAAPAPATTPAPAPLPSPTTAPTQPASPTSPATPTPSPSAPATSTTAPPAVTPTGPPGAGTPAKP